MRTSTVLVILFADDGSIGPLDGLINSLQKGLNAAKGQNPPEIYVLYCRDQTVAKQYRLVAGCLQGIPPETCDALTNCTQQTGTMCEQISKFLSNPQVTDALKNNKGRRYVFLGSHGKVAAGLSVYPLPLIRLLRWMLAVLFQISFIRDWADSLWRTRSGYAPDVAFPRSRIDPSTFITLEQLNTLLKPIGPDALVLHSCLLGGVEAIYELRFAKQLIACESDLNGSMDASQWFPAIKRGRRLGALARAATAFGAQGIFASWNPSSSAKATRFIHAINKLGADLLTRLQTPSQQSAIQTAIENARKSSRITSDAVDLWQFCEQLEPACSANVCRVLQRAIDRLQTDRVLTSNYLWNERTRYFRGMSAYLPPAGTDWDVSTMPADFRTDANQWMAFLQAWQQ